MRYYQPFNSFINMDELKMDPEGEVVTRKLSDMSYMYQNQEAVKEVIDKDPTIYRFYTSEVPDEEGHLKHVISTLLPGKIGNEYYMTKGHFHEMEDTAEIYVTLQGKGKLVMQTPDNDTKILEMEKGSIGYIPPYWAHRCVNTGKEPLVFFGVYLGGAGHNYGIIEDKGMKKLVLEIDGKTIIKDNPDY